MPWSRSFALGVWWSRWHFHSTAGHRKSEFTQYGSPGRVLSDLKGMGHEIVLVSSGAIAIGTRKLGRAAPGRAGGEAGRGRCGPVHDDARLRQIFSEYNRTVAQILLTGEDVDAPRPVGAPAQYIRSAAGAGRDPCGQRKRLGLFGGDRDRRRQGAGRQRHPCPPSWPACAGPICLSCSPTSTGCTTPTPAPIRRAAHPLRTPHTLSCGPWRAALAPGVAPAAWSPSSTPPRWQWTPGSYIRSLKMGRMMEAIYDIVSGRGRGYAFCGPAGAKGGN